VQSALGLVGHATLFDHIERWVLFAAAVATIIAVLFAVPPILFALREQKKGRRQGAALVLPRLDVLKGHIKSAWWDGLAYDGVHPDLSTVEAYLRDVNQETSLASDLADRASQIDPELAIYAELVFRKIRGIWFALAQAQHNAPSDRSVLNPTSAAKLDGQWNGHRRRILILAESAREILTRMEKWFPADATTVGGISRPEFLKRTDDEVEPLAVRTVEKALKQLAETGFIE